MKLLFEQKCGVPDERLAANDRHARSLGFQFVGPWDGERGPLNVVGRGPSVVARLDELENSVASIWACGSAFAWCRNNGLDATLVCLDPLPAMAAHVKDATRALVATICDPALFEALGDAAVTLFDTAMIVHGTTALSCVPELALTAGYTELRFYGCDSSFGEMTHADSHYPTPHTIQVECGGEKFLTNPQMLLQAQEMWGCFAEHPKIFIDKSGGLLGAMIRSRGEYEVTAATRAYRDTLTLPGGGNPGWGDDGVADAGAQRAAE